MTQIDPEVRSAMLDLVDALAVFHPQIREAARPTEYECTTCARVDRALALLDAEQRQYGPAIDVSDPSYTGAQA